MKTRPIISIIVPCYGVENYLDRCMDSILNQDYTDFEIILVDDKSPDKVPDMCDKWMKRDKRINVIHKQVNEGLGYARNTGLEAATGTYVVFIDSDDFIAHNYLSVLYHNLINNNAEFASGSIIRYKGEHEQYIDRLCEKNVVVDHENIVSCVLNPILGGDTHAINDVEREMCVWRNIYIKSIIDKYNIRFVSERDYISEDILFNMEYILNIKRAVLVSTPIYYYCENGSSLTHTYRADRFIKNCELYKKQIQMLEEYSQGKESKDRVLRSFIMKAKKSLCQIANSNLSFIEKITRSREVVENNLLQYEIKNYHMKSTFVNNLILFLIKHKATIPLFTLYRIKNANFN